MELFYEPHIFLSHLYKPAQMNKVFMVAFSLCASISYPEQHIIAAWVNEVLLYITVKVRDMN